ncbi:hypothetical protein AB0A05_07620 [Streptomyces sp. NPDC046374]|uniref:hypothetical protein n=1 Tax=Streptomyces sp. NPDC046374 TaxID=3154917 RepID=UPI0033C4B5E1
MNPDFLPLLGAALRKLGEYATRHEVNDSTLAEIAADLDRARSLVSSARGGQRANRCTQHPGAPVDPTATNGCMFCGPGERRPARELPEDFAPGDVLRAIEEHGQESATERFGGRAVTHAVALRNRHPSTRRPGLPVQPDDVEGETP